MDSLFLHSPTVKFDKESYRKVPYRNRRLLSSMKTLSSVAQDLGINLFISKYKFYQKRSKTLTHAWQLDNNKWNIIKKPKVNLMIYKGKTRDIYNEIKKMEKRVNIPIVNDLQLEVICDDKLLTYSLFPELSPKTILINDHFQLFKVLRNIETDYVVLKPRFGSMGKNVRIIHKNKLLNGISNNTILQEFIDSKNGIKELNIKKQHDFRFIIINGKIDHTYVRVPRDNSFISNASLGAVKKFIDLEDIPSKMINFVKNIDKTFIDFKPRIYSVDIMKDKDNNIKLVELNSKPGTLFYDDALKIRKRFFKNQLKAIANYGI